MGIGVPTMEVAFIFLILFLLIGFLQGIDFFSQILTLTNDVYVIAFYDIFRRNLENYLDSNVHG